MVFIRSEDSIPLRKTGCQMGRSYTIGECIRDEFIAHQTSVVILGGHVHGRSPTSVRVMMMMKTQGVFKTEELSC